MTPALNVITEEVDRLRTHRRFPPAGSSWWKPWARHAGWLAFEGGQAAGALVILIPGMGLRYGPGCELVSARRQAGCAL
jgi:6-phosphofructokinase